MVMLAADLAATGGFVAEAIENYAFYDNGGLEHTEMSGEETNSRGHVPLCDGITNADTQIASVSQSNDGVQAPSGYLELQMSGNFGYNRLSLSEKDEKKDVCSKASGGSFYLHELSESSKRGENSISWNCIGGVLTISGTGRMPSYMEEKPGWAKQAESIVELVVESGITHIGSCAFEDLSSLKKAALPDTLVSMGEAVFYGCSSLESIAIPTGVQVLDSGAFAKCTSLTSIEMPGVTTIKSYALESVGIREFRVGRYLTRIDPLAFFESEIVEYTCHPDNTAYSIQDGVLYSKDASRLIAYPPEKEGEFFQIPSTVKTVGEAAFIQNKNLVYITIPDSVTSLLESSFQNMRYLAEIQIPDSVTYVGDFTFLGCGRLTAIKLGNGLEETSYQMFRKCESLTSIDFGDNLALLGMQTFSYCSSLTEVSLPSNITQIRGSCFARCSALKSFTSRALTHLPAGVFMYCDSLSDVTINEGMEKIYRNAFYGCGLLNAITLPESVNFVDEDAFPKTTAITCKNMQLQKYGCNGYRLLENIMVHGSENYEYAFKVLDAVNSERKAEGLPALVMDQSLLTTAMRRAMEISACFSHTRPDGACCFSANDKVVGENVAAGQRRPDSVMDSWMNSKGHRANILMENYTTIGIGCYESNGTYYWTQCFGRGDAVQNCAVPSNRSVTGTVSLAVEAFDEANTDEVFRMDSNDEYSYRFKVGLDKKILKAGNATKAELYLENAGAFQKEILIEPGCFAWTSNADSVATVGADGTVYAVSDGRAEIAAVLKYYHAKTTIMVGVEGDPEQVFSGKGKKNNPYIISSLSELQLLSDCVNEGKNFEDCYFKLTADIAINDTSGFGGWTDEAGPANLFVPIGTEKNPFQGYFDGNGHTISGLYVITKASYAGLFGYVGSGGRVKNLMISDFYLHTTNGSLSDADCIGGVVGYLKGEISNVKAVGQHRLILSAKDGLYDPNRGSVAGVIAGCCEGGKLTDCGNEGTLTEFEVYGGQFVEAGGICGVMFGNTLVNNCYSTSEISLSAKESEAIRQNQVAGIVGGTGIGGKILNCYNTGNITGTSKNAASMQIGGICTASDGPIRNCFNKGTLTAHYLRDFDVKYTIGGIATDLDGSNASNGSGVTACGSIENCCNLGQIEGDSSYYALRGALVGSTDEDCDVSNSYWSDAILDKVAYCYDEYIGKYVEKEDLHSCYSVTRAHTVNNGNGDSLVDLLNSVVMDTWKDKDFTSYRRWIIADGEVCFDDNVVTGQAGGNNGTSDEQTAKKVQNIVLSKTAKTVKSKTLKNKRYKFTIAVKGTKGKLKIISSDKKSVKAEKNGKKVTVTVKKGTKKGIYSVKVRAEGTSVYRASSWQRCIINVK